MPTTTLDARTTPLLDARGRPLKGVKWVVFLDLDGRARNKTYCWPGTAEIAAACGRSERAVELALKDLEDDELIERVRSAQGKSVRVGIILRKRIDPARPAAGSPGALEMARKSLIEQRGRRADRNRQRLQDALEDLCGERPYGRTGNKELARRLRVSTRCVQAMLADLVRDGSIHRVMTEGGTHGRLGIVLLKRSDPDRPAAGTEEELLAATAALKALEPALFDESDPDGTRGATPGAGGPTARADGAPSGGERRAQNLRPGGRTAGAKFAPGIRTSLPLKKDKSPEAEPRKNSPERQRPDPPAAAGPGPEGGHIVPPAPEPPRSPGPPPATAAGAWAPPKAQEFLDGLAPEQRARFEAMTGPKRDQLWGLFTRGLLTTLDRELSAGTPLTLTPPEPATTAELIAGLTTRGAPRAWVAKAVSAVIWDFGGAKDQRMWHGFERVFTAVWEGHFDARAAADAYRQAMNPKSENRGAVFNTALKRHGWVW
jgi:DNA-binding HxlR family transcriptional regulator